MKAPKKVYVLSQGSYGKGDSLVWAVVETKKAVKQACKEHGYKWSSFDQMFLKDEDKTWISVDTIVIGEVDSGEEVSFGLNKEQREARQDFEDMYKNLGI
jgi:hypothetical protein